MLMRTIWKCEHCGKQSEDKNEILACEASHYGLTIEEKDQWDYLKFLVHQASCIVSARKNEQTDKDFDNAIKNLMRFEEEHHL